MKQKEYIKGILPGYVSSETKKSFKKGREAYFYANKHRIHPGNRLISGLFLQENSA